MSQNERYDFSQDSVLKPKLLDKLKTEYAKTNQAALADDELDLVAAAGVPGTLTICPYSTPCIDCTWFKGYCLKRMFKDEGGGRCV